MGLSGALFFTERVEHALAIFDRQRLDALQQTPVRVVAKHMQRHVLWVIIVNVTTRVHARPPLQMPRKRARVAFYGRATELAVMPLQNAGFDTRKRIVVHGLREGRSRVGLATQALAYVRIWHFYLERVVNQTLNCECIS